MKTAVKATDCNLRARKCKFLSLEPLGLNLFRKKMNTCGHPDRPHYAKSMCNQCYHRHGRTKKPWKCNHERLYAHGLCQNCYINAYNKVLNFSLNII